MGSFPIFVCVSFGLLVCGLVYLSFYGLYVGCLWCSGFNGSGYGVYYVCGDWSCGLWYYCHCSDGKFVVLERSMVLDCGVFFWIDSWSERRRFLCEGLVCWGLLEFLGCFLFGRFVCSGFVRFVILFCDLMVVANWELSMLCTDFGFGCYRGHWVRRLCNLFSSALSLLGGNNIFICLNSLLNGIGN